jgi:Histidine kinase-, DNA gyrase B-, and HSP90-like ATPase
VEQERWFAFPTFRSQAGPAEPPLERREVHPGGRTGGPHRHAGRGRHHHRRQRHGIGIAPEDQATIFEEFRQVGRDDTRKQEGTGLGLTLAKKFVELHGGRIWVESKVGKGSTFTFSLPVGHGE